MKLARPDPPCKAGKRNPRAVEVDQEAAPRLVTYREASALCDPETLALVLGHGKHYLTDGRRPRPYWLADDFEDCLGLVEIETGGGLS